MGRLTSLLSRLSGLGSGSSFASPSRDFICAACQTQFRREHHECPECGSPIVVPIEETDHEDSL